MFIRAGKQVIVPINWYNKIALCHCFFSFFYFFSFFFSLSFFSFFFFIGSFTFTSNEFLTEWITPSTGSTAIFNRNLLFTKEKAMGGGGASKSGVGMCVWERARDVNGGYLGSHGFFRKPLLIMTDPDLYFYGPFLHCQWLAMFVSRFRFCSRGQLFSFSEVLFFHFRFLSSECALFLLELPFFVFFCILFVLLRYWQCFRVSF